MTLLVKQIKIKTSNNQGQHFTEVNITAVNCWLYFMTGARNLAAMIISKSPLTFKFDKWYLSCDALNDVS